MAVEDTDDAVAVDKAGEDAAASVAGSVLSVSDTSNGIIMVSGSPPTTCSRRIFLPFICVTSLELAQAFRITPWGALGLLLSI